MTASHSLQVTIPTITRSALHCCLQRHGIDRLPKLESDKYAKKQKLKSYPIGYFQLDIAEVRTEEGKLRLFAADDCSMQFVDAELHASTDKIEAAQFLRNLIAAVPTRSVLKMIRNSD